MGKIFYKRPNVAVLTALMTFTQLISADLRKLMQNLAGSNTIFTRIGMYLVRHKGLLHEQIFYGHLKKYTFWLRHP